VMIGSDFRSAVRHERCGFVPWTHITTDEPGYFSSLDFDIGLAPVTSSAFNRSKSFLKALEYGARGIPVIASDFEPYSSFVLHGVTGFLVKAGHEWGRYLAELAGDAGLRESMGAKAKEQARSWCIEDGWRKWETAYQSLL
jgi:glycosyltransferase involved in cell wall biosynthesis